MKKGIFFSFILSFFALISFAQEIIDTAAIKKQLEIILDQDQKTRMRGDSTAYMQFIDSTNLLQIEALIKKYGWPGKSFVGSRDNTAVFFVIQHAELAAQEKYLPMLQKSVALNESRATDLALLQDRVLMRQNKKQIYGSQVVRDEATGGWKFYLIEDEKNVNIRRQKIGLEPMEEYAKHFGINYKLPDQ